MPYKDLSDLPKSVREHLPIHAQEIYQAAYNVYQRTSTALAYRRDFDTDSSCLVELHHRHLSHYRRRFGVGQMILHNIKKANDISDFHQNYLYANPQPGFL